MNRNLFFLVFLFYFIGVSNTFAVSAPPDWKNWSTHPRVPTMEASQVQQLLLGGEKMLLIYAGYRTDKIICGSVHVPYTLTPPFNNGSKVQPVFPKDTWLVVYCP